MEKELIESAQTICSWTPAVITEFVKAVIWPITVLIIGFRYRSGISNAFTKFLERNNVKEFKAGTGGISATFEKADQNIKAMDLSNSRNTASLEHDNLEAIQKKHSENTTEFSEVLLASIRRHVESLEIDDSEKVALLTTEVSLLQSAIQFFHVNKVLFRSQFDLFSEAMYERESVSIDYIKEYFASIVSAHLEDFKGWDYVKYLSYPIGVGLLVTSGEGYKLSKFGESYVVFMRRNIQFIDELSNL